MGKRKEKVAKQSVETVEVPKKKAKKAYYSAFAETINTACKKLAGTECTLDGNMLTPPGESVTVKFPKNVSVKPVGSHLTRTDLNGSHIDMVVVVEYDSVFGPTDDLKFVYFHKKQAIMKMLREALNGTVIDAFLGNFECVFEDKKYLVRFGVSVKDDFKLYRLAPGRMNVLNEQKLPTPIYNSSILRDIHYASIDEYVKNTLNDDESARECLKMVKAWHLKMSFDKYVGMFDSVATSSLFCHWFNNNDSLKGCESMQLFKGFMTYLSMKDWTEAIQIGKFDGQLPSDRKTVFDLAAFKSASLVVLVDSTGTINLAASADIKSLSLYSHFAKCLLECLNGSRQVSLESLLVNKCSDLDLFDLVMDVDVTGKCDELDVIYNPIPTISLAKKAVDIVNEALKERILFISAKVTANNRFQLLLKVNTEKCFGLVEFGPNPEDSGAVANFKRLWGESAGLRKFPNGNVQFAVAWPELANKRHLIIPTAIKQLLKHHKISAKQTCLCDNLDFLLEPTNDEVKLKPFSYFIEAFDNLSSLLRGTTKLPLAIVQVVPISDTLRYTAVFPTTVEPRVAGRASPVSEALLIFEKSSKWPEDLQAVKAAKHAFLLQVQRVLEQDHKLPCSIDNNNDFLDVFFKSIVFRLRIRVEKELALMAKEGLTEELGQLTHFYEERPLFHAKVHALACQNAVFGSTVRMVKRWAASQLFSFISEEFFEAMTAIAFTDSSLGSTPGSVIAGFHRTLSLIADHAVSTPFVFDPDRQLDINTLSDIQKDTTMSLYCSFLKNGKYNLPTVIDAAIWKQLQKIAKATLLLFESETDLSEIVCPVLLDHLRSFKIDQSYNNSVLTRRNKKAAEIVDKTVRKAAGPMADFVKSLPGLIFIDALAEKIHKDHGIFCYYDKYTGDHLAFGRKESENIDFAELNDILVSK